MDAEEFRRRGKEMIDYVADYLESIRDRRPLSNVQPGYLKDLIPAEAPEQPESWEDVFNDIERVIIPGVCIQLSNFCQTVKLPSNVRSINIASLYSP